jgi:DNA-3-methyladenine glycosylase II
MAKEYYEKLSKLITGLGLEAETNLYREVKHFFSGAAFYVNGEIRASLSPAGLAFRLPKDEVNELIRSSQAIPLKYFPKGHIKKDYALFENPDLSQMQIWKPYFRKAISLAADQHRLYPAALNHQSLLEGISYLCEIDPDLRQIVSQIGNPPLWSREPGFSTLIHIILEQQVSLASARAAFTKLENAAGELTPERFIEFTDIELREFGFSRQKARYGRRLSEAIINGDLDLDRLQALDDKTARNTLIKIKGIGPWTADIYLLMALLRPDIWPAGDLALAKAVQKIKHSHQKPNPDQINEIAEPWMPFRAVAARILWHFYLCGITGTT